jgi:hypothetical protein
MDSVVQLTASDLSDEDLQVLTRELSKTLNDETNVRAILPEEPSEAGAKADVAITVGQIILTALTSGTVVALFNVIKAYIERKPSLELEFNRQDGKQLKIRAEHLGKNQIDQTIKLANDFIGE